MNFVNDICSDSKSYGVRPFIHRSEGVDFIHPTVILANQEQCKKFFGENYDKIATADVGHGTIILNVEALINELLNIRKTIFKNETNTFEATTAFKAELLRKVFDIAAEEIVHLNSVRISRNSDNPDTFDFGVGFYLSGKGIDSEQKDAILNKLRERRRPSLYYAVGENGLLQDKENFRDDAYDAIHDGDIDIILLELLTMFVVSSMTELKLSSSKNGLLFIIQGPDSEIKTANDLWGENHFYLRGNEIPKIIQQLFGLIKNPDGAKSLKILETMYQSAPKAKNSSLSFSDMITLLYKDYLDGTTIGTEKYKGVSIVAALPQAMNVGGKRTMLSVDILGVMNLNLNN